MKMQNMVEGFAFTESKFGQDVALILKNHPEWMKGKYNGIGGRIEEGESPVQAMVREFQEETGVSWGEEKWQHYVSLVGKFGIVHFFRTYMPNEVFERIDTTTDEVVHKFPVDNIPMNKIPNLSWLIPLASDPDIQCPAILSEDFSL